MFLYFLVDKHFLSKMIEVKFLEYLECQKKTHHSVGTCHLRYGVIVFWVMRPIELFRFLF